jgi:hypothetical protein
VLIGSRMWKCLNWCCERCRGMILLSLKRTLSENMYSLESLCSEHLELKSWWMTAQLEKVSLDYMCPKII